MENTDKSDSIINEGFGCLGLLLLFAICFGAPSFAYHAFGSWVAILASVTAVVAWLYLGPPFFPGFLPGILGVGVILNSIGWVGFSLYGIIRAWLNAKLSNSRPGCYARFQPITFTFSTNFLIALLREITHMKVLCITVSA
jgi:hypothetical protein